MWHKHHSPTSRTEYAVQLAQSLAVIFDMFEDMVANHHIYALIFERNILHIEVANGVNIRVDRNSVYANAQAPVAK